MKRSGIASLWATAIAIMLLSACQQKTPTPFESEIYLVRHFQKETPIDGNKDVNLTKLGKRNAVLLAEHLQGKNILSIYSSDYQRTQQTAAPSSDAFNIPVTLYDPSILQNIASQLLAVNHNQLVVGHSNTTGVLFGLLGCESVALTESDYGDIFVVKRIHASDSVTLSACSRYSLANESLSMANEYKPDFSKIKFVKKSDLGKYWQQTNTTFRFDASHSSASNNMGLDSSITSIKQSGAVEIGFVIDKEGNTSSFELLRSQPSMMWDAQAIEAAKQLMFMPVQTPQENIYTTWVFTFQAD